MSKPIVVGYDPRTTDEAPVRLGIALARLTGARLVVAAVQAGAPVIAVSADTVAVPIAQVDEDLVSDCSATLDRLAAELSAEGIPAVCRKLRGTSAARALHEAAEEEDAGLLVVGSSRRGAADRVLLGSTTTRLVAGAPCPIAVAPRGWEGTAFKTIGVAYSDSEEAREALRGAHALARRAGATLHVVTVVKVTPAMYEELEPATAAHPGERKELVDVEGEHRVRAERHLREVVAQLDGGVDVEVDAFVGDPAETLIGLSERLDLLVCGSRGYGPLRAVLLGSVTRRVMEEARCPVIVLPRGVKASLEALVLEAPDAAAR